MFTGLIESVGIVKAVLTIPAGVRLNVEAGMAQGVSIGDSVAVNGVCLTVSENGHGVFAAEVSPETARVTALGRAVVGTEVNLERPLRADGRLGGHFVLGHVDGVGKVGAIQAEADFHRITIKYPSALTSWVVEKGSIAIDGISLTVASLSVSELQVQIVPFTWEHTNLRKIKVDDAVNLECDIIGKYVIRALENR